MDLILREKGILASFRKWRSKKSKVPSYTLNVSETEAVQQLSYLLTKDKQKLIRLRKRTIKSPAYRRVTENLALLPIKKIEAINQEKTVYALETKTGYYLTSGGILTHNCLPKDIRALIEFADKQGVNLELHKKAEELNNRLMDEQKIDDPEKFSKRE